MTNNEDGTAKHQQHVPDKLKQKRKTQVLGVFGALLGAMWAQGGRQERFKWLLGAARGAKSNY